MHRILVLIAVVVIICVGLGLASIVDSHTLAKQSFAIGSSTVVFRVKEIDGCLYASAHEQRAFDGGKESILMIGSRADVGDVEPTILLTADGTRVILGVGSALAEYSAATETLGPIRSPR